MNAIVRKAKAGVTLVELLVVILIVTILSVSMLPLLQPFVVESQYAAEPIPVIGNLRTKVGLYQYDKGKLPSYGMVQSSVGEGETATTVQNPQVETWMMVENAQGSSPASEVTDYFKMATANFPSAVPPLTGLSVFNPAADTSATAQKHFGTLCDIDYQELKGKRSKPCHYQYLVMLNGTDYAYFLGCFGDGNGLKAGTGYAVCEIVSTSSGHKYVGTWRRYKALGTAQICFTSSTDLPEGDTDYKHTLGCYVPTKGMFDAIVSGDATAGTTNDESLKTLITTMETYGWEF